MTTSKETPEQIAVDEAYTRWRNDAWEPNDDLTGRTWAHLTPEDAFRAGAEWAIAAWNNRARESAAPIAAWIQRWRDLAKASREVAAKQEDIQRHMELSIQAQLMDQIIGEYEAASGDDSGLAETPLEVAVTSLIHQIETVEAGHPMYSYVTIYKHTLRKWSNELAAAVPPREGEK